MCLLAASSPVSRAAGLPSRSPHPQGDVAVSSRAERCCRRGPERPGPRLREGRALREAPIGPSRDHLGPRGASGTPGPPTSGTCRDWGGGGHSSTQKGKPRHAAAGASRQSGLFCPSLLPATHLETCPCPKALTSREWAERGVATPSGLQARRKVSLEPREARERRTERGRRGAAVEAG